MSSYTSTEESSECRLGTYRLGCPVFNSPGWLGSFLPSKCSKSRWLREYGTVFDTVEGNSTFYGLPAEATVQRWITETPPTFRFVPKFPREISHEDLSWSNSAIAPFMGMLEQLHDAKRLGPVMLQLPPAFGPSSLFILESFLEQLPLHLSYSVEVRHMDFFDRSSNEQRLNEVLTSAGVDKVLLDSRPLFSRPSEDETEQISQTRKPKVPVRQTLTGKNPILRLIGRNRVDSIDDYLNQWAPIVAKWIDNGLSAYIFIHTPDDSFAPQLARRFHQALQTIHSAIEPMRRWPIERDRPLFS